MADDHYPTIDASFIKSLIEASSYLKDAIKVGSTTAYILKGKWQETINIRDADDELDFIYATNIALRIKCMGEVVDWLYVHRGWKSGGYTETISRDEL